MLNRFVHLLFILFIGTVALPAQNLGNFISVDAGGGMNGLYYSLKGGAVSPRMGSTFGVGYSRFTLKEWGLHIGLGIQTYSSEVRINNTDSILAVDNDGGGQSYYRKAVLSGYRERQQAVFIELPVALQYRHEIDTHVDFLSSLGFKVSVPLFGSYTTLGDSISYRGYYPQYNVDLYGLPVHNFGSDGKIYSGNLSFKSTFTAFIEAGLLYRLDQDADLYVGTYFNTALANILSNSNNPICSPDGQYYGALTSKNVSSAVTPIAFGIKIGLFMHISNFKSEGIYRSKGANSTANVTGGTYNRTGKILRDNEFIKDGHAYHSHNGVNDNAPLPGTKVPWVDSVVTKNYNSLTKDKDVKSLKRKGSEGDSLLKQPPITMKGKANHKNIFVPILQFLLGRKDSITTASTKDSTKKELNLPVDSLAKEEGLATEKVNELVGKLNLNLKFASGSDKIVNPNMEMVSQISALLILHPNIKLKVVGHTDNVASFQFNFVLGRKRAMAVQQLFMNQGVPQQQIQVRSRSFLEPLFPNNNDMNRAANRRAELFVVKSTKKVVKMSRYLKTMPASSQVSLQE
jgi:outer membrane protein OmpA-like peptidoglycan-associated protein